MKYKKMSTYSYNLHVIKTDKFKTVTVKVNFKRKLVKNEITYRNMIINTLCESTLEYPTKRLMTIATENLYDLYYKGMNYISGKYNIMSFDVTFLNEEYTEKGMLDKSIKFLSDIIFKPNIEKNKTKIKFKEENFNLAFTDKLNVVVQRIYQHYKGYSSIDEVRDIKKILIIIVELECLKIWNQIHFYHIGVVGI